MSSSSNRFKLSRWWWGLVLILPATAWILSTRLDADYLERVINNTLVPATKGLYFVEIGDVSYSVLFGNFAVGDLELNLNAAVLDSLEAAAQAPALQFSGQLREASIEGVSLFRLLFRNELEAERFLIRRPRIEVAAGQLLMPGQAQGRDSLRTDAGPESEHSGATEEVQAYLQQLPFFSIEQIIAEDVEVNLVATGPNPENEKAADLTSRLEGLSFTLENVRVDESRLREPRQIALSAEARLRFDELHLEIAPQMVLDVDTLALSTLEETLEIGRIRWTPTFTEDDFLNGGGSGRDRIVASVGPVRLSGLDYHSIVSDLMFHMRHGEIENLAIDVLSDKQRSSSEAAETKREEFMPHSFVQDLPFWLLVDTLDVSAGTIKYSERGLRGPNVGSITIDGLEARVTHITNREVAPESDRFALIKAKARLFGSTPAQVTVELPLLDEPPSMRLSASASGFDPVAVNSILPALEGLRVVGGTVDTAWLNIDYGPELATGQVAAVYRDLKIRIESPETGEQNLGHKIVDIGAKLGLRAANEASHDKPPRSGKVDYKISIDRPFFQIFWEAIRDGLLRLVRKI